MILYHCTTDRKYKRYQQTGHIIMPVRGWNNLESAKKWNKHTGRNIILKLKCEVAYPLPDHKPMFHSYWTPENIYVWDIIENEERVS
jgi:hypothetical protein